MSMGYHEEGLSQIHQLERITADDIVDLGRWFSVQFRNEKTAATAFDRYYDYLERQRKRRIHPE